MSESARQKVDRKCSRSLMLALSLFVGIAQASADAVPVAPAPSDDAMQTADAQRHFRQAIALYNDGNFEAALAEFLAAYRTKPAPSILYNIGLTYKSLFLYNDAIRFLDQYLREETKLAPERRAEVEQIQREMHALLADVSLAITPDGANVKLDGRTIGRAPIGQYLIAAGRHVLEVSSDGYVSQTKELMVTAGLPMALAVSLAIIPKTGRVRVTVDPTSASVKIDGKIYPPPLDLELPLGGHTLESWATGYPVYREEILIAAGQTRDVRVTLHHAPIYKRAALWVPVSIGIVLVVGGITAGALCGTGHCSDSILSGTLNPGSANVGK